MPRVAYFSPEFGVSERIPQYSGGLGVLAGDYLRVCADEGWPLVGVGLFYHQGYFHQRLDQSGWQQEGYLEQDPNELGLVALGGEVIELGLGERALRARVWRQQVGRVPLYLLDTTGVENPEDLTLVTDRLYGGDIEHRLLQEILLGMGGVKALELAGEHPLLFHSNEGHAGFLVLERIRKLVEAEGLRFEEALEAARAGTIFTTHTPVPAGIDHFPRELMARYFQPWCEAVGIPLNRLMELGHFPGQAPEDPFNMAVMGLRLSGQANAVSQLHRTVSRRMFADLWPDLLPEEVPIRAVTNGVHAKHWISREMRHLLERYLGPRWDVHGAVDWSRLKAASDQELWEARQAGRLRLIEGARHRLELAESGRGVPEGERDWTKGALEPRALTVGFARRVAEYKRALLLFSQPERLSRLLLDPDRPVQLVIAGKAHPQDHQGKEIIQALSEAARAPELRSRVVFLEDFDMGVARLLYQGADLWLNTPRRPMEACGTSGQKALLSGALNCSILDGWWDEGWDGESGFAIPSSEQVEDQSERDRLEADALFELLENEIIPTFYGRTEDGPPHRWLAKVRHSLEVLGPLVLGSRMVADYVRLMYQPAVDAAVFTPQDRHQVARDRAAWWERVRRDFPSTRVSARAISHEEGAESQPEGEEKVVEALVELGPLPAEDVQVELLHGPIGADGRLISPSVEPMVEDQPHSNGNHRYLGALVLGAAGEYGYTVRLLPRPPGSDPLPAETPVSWAEPARRPR
ncbi:MAG TPA: alpha-glucan family phosphorylase [Candidatus Dormibacteraeota bacterium]|nr:alpha-glucan family phosphorylase [Candidatus Dormibacteraeota bacterium]